MSYDWDQPPVSIEEREWSAYCATLEAQIEELGSDLDRLRNDILDLEDENADLKRQLDYFHKRLSML